MSIEDLTRHLKSRAISLLNGDDLQPLYQEIRGRKIVMLGEATHGTKEFYEWRSVISKYLISNMNFKFIAVEGDWPACFEVDKYIKGKSKMATAEEVLETAFSRWPAWMWANRQIEELVEWLKEYNSDLKENEKIGFFGLDVYSLTESFDSILKFLKEHDPDGLEVAREAFQCFKSRGFEGQKYARSLKMVDKGCEKEVIEMLNHMNREKIENNKYYIFDAKQNALIIKNAERYYRSMISGTDDSWNIRDRHMMDTLRILFEYHKNGNGIVWAHNTHIGDARATDMIEDELINLGQLVREEYKGLSFALGFSTDKGEVLAGDYWGSEVKIKNVPEAKHRSWEGILHAFSSSNLLIIWHKEDEKNEILNQKLMHRAIGVVYSSNYEADNYVPSLMVERYDALIHINTSTSLVPIKKIEKIDEIPDTYPYGV